MSETVSAVASTCQADPAEEAKLAQLSAAAPVSLGGLFFDRVAKTPDAEAFRAPDGAGGWTSYTWAQTGQIVSELAAGLLALGLLPEQRVSLAAATRVEWIQADLAVLAAGGATTTIYPTSTPEDIHLILTDSGSRFAFAENATTLAKLRSGETALEQVFLIDGEPAAGDDAVMSMAALRELGRQHLDRYPDAVTEATAAVTAEQVATLVYTSGTTGRPKGVRLAHRAWVYEGLAVAACGLLEPDDVGYLWLPLSHVFGKTLISSQIATGYCNAVEGAVDKIIVNLPVVRPTVMAAAPRIFEKIYAGVIRQVESEGGAKLKVYRWAIDVGLRVSRMRRDGREPTGLLALQHRLADRLVFQTIRNRFGGRIRLFISGSAALSKDIAEWMHAVGLLVLEGYGLTETAAAALVNRPNRFELGAVGTPLPGTEVRIAPDGEILIRGPEVMQGYHGLEQETAAALSPDGWLRTGDVGEITARGSVRITDRKKDLIKTSGGKYVAPQTIETRFKAICPLASQIVVHGEGRNYVTALIALDPDAVKLWAPANGLGDADLASVASSQRLQETIGAYVDELNSGLNRWETVKKFAVLDQDLTVEDGALTPSLKLKRKVVEKRYAHILDDFYTG